MDLKTYLETAGLTQVAFAAEVGTTHATISRLCAGKFRPSLQLAIAIDRATDGAVAVTSWGDDVTTPATEAAQ